MKRLFTANTPADEGTAQLLRAALDEAGIPCMIRNESLSVGKGDIPFTECVPELWILNDEELPKAKAIVDAELAAATMPRAAWVCSGCGEASEGQFGSCWKCGKDRGEA